MDINKLKLKDNAIVGKELRKVLSKKGKGERGFEGYESEYVTDFPLA